MKFRVFFLVPIVLSAIIIVNIQPNLIKLKPIKEINLGTLLLSFPVILALTERFNEVFVVSKKVGKEENVNKTSLASFSIGVFLAIAGFRILENFMEVPSKDIPKIFLEFQTLF